MLFFYQFISTNIGNTHFIHSISSNANTFDDDQIVKNKLKFENNVRPVTLEFRYLQKQCTVDKANFAENCYSESGVGKEKISN